MRNISIPDLSLVVLIGATGSGKSTFARRYFKDTEILSSDYCRALVSDDENSQEATNDAFEVLHFIASKRLARGKIVVVDATNVQASARKPLIALAKRFHVVPVALVLDMSMDVCYSHNRERPDRQFGPHVVRGHVRDLRQSLRGLQREGFRHIHVFRSPEETEDLTIAREPLWTDRRTEHGPFDIVGDVHGCYDELVELLHKLGWAIEPSVSPPAPDRKLVFLGDLVDRGPDSVSVLKLAMAMQASGHALVIPGNHDAKLLRKLDGRDVKMSHGLAETWAQLEQEPPEFKLQVREFLDRLISHFVLDDGKLVVAHAGMKEAYAGRASGEIREFALYGETTGETDEFGLPIRYDWALEYKGRARVVYGHTPVVEPEWLNHTINIDTGCVFGGKLTALRYPEMDLVSVPAKEVYSEPIRPIGAGMKRGGGAQHEADDILDIDDILGKRLIETKLRGRITIQEENAIAALETMSRFAANPKWLVYLPPTMSPTETSHREDLLEHPDEAFAYYRKQGTTHVVCEEKHMGSRAVVVLCRDEAVAAQRFGISGEGIGCVLTRTGRRFFDDASLQAALLGRLEKAMAASGLWEKLSTDWVILDCELMPWSAKAQALLRDQYAAVGAAALNSSSFAVDVLKGVPETVEGASALLGRLQDRALMAQRFVDSYRRYCWPVESIEDFRLAPFHILASEGAVHTDKDHTWHMETLATLCEQDPVLVATPFRVVSLEDSESCQSAADWWTELTGRGGEGMVVKPLSFLVRGPDGLGQPAVKCRGREYLRIIYGPEYTTPENLSRLRHRGVGRKRSLAIREFALGIEALERFVAREPLRRVHECVFGVLALESEPVDPRL